MALIPYNKVVPLDKSYLKELTKRSKESKVYVKFQLQGLEIAQILGDEKHKSLYIKLCKNGNPEELLRLAKNIAENRNVKNKGAYFMSCLKTIKSSK